MGNVVGLRPRTSQPQRPSSLIPRRDLAVAWAFGQQFGSGAVALRELVSGRFVSRNDGNNYLSTTQTLNGVAGNPTGPELSAISYTDTSSALNGLTSMTLMAWFQFSSTDASAQWMNLRGDFQHSLDVFSQTASSITWGSDWAGAWNSASQQTLSGLKDGDLVCLVAVINQAGARLFHNGIFSGAKAGSAFTTASTTINLAARTRAKFFGCVGLSSALSDTEALSLSRNPWQLWAPEEETTYFAAGVAATLTAAQTSQSALSSGGAITQTQTLAGAPSNQAAVSSSAGVIQVHTLVGTTGSQAGGSAAAAITQAHVLISAAITQASTSSSGAITQSHSLVGAVTSQSPNGGAGAVVQTQILNGAATVQSATSGIGNISQGAVHILVNSPSSQANASDSGVVTQTHLLSGTTSSQANVSPAGGVVQTHSLTGAATSQAAVSGTGAVSQGSVHSLVGATSSQGNVSNSGAITQTTILTGSASFQSATSGEGGVVQSHALVGSNTTQTAVSGVSAITSGSVHILAGSTCSSVASGGVGAIIQIQMLAASTDLQISTSPGASVSQVHYLAGALSNQTALSGTGALAASPDAVLTPVELREMYALIKSMGGKKPLTLPQFLALR